MVTGTTEKTTSQKLEAAINQVDEPSTDQVETSEETAEETLELPKAEETEEEEATEEPDGIKWTEEQQAEIDKLVQAESDRKSNTYRTRHESNSELIKTLQQENTDLKRQVSSRTGETRLKKLLADYDDEGLPEEGKKTFAEELKEYNQKIDEYNQRSEQVEATVKFIDEMAKGLEPAIAKQFYLNDPNPNIRAGGGIDLVNEAIANIKEHKRFLRVVEKFFPKGDEVRTQLDEIIKGMADYDGNEKAENLYLSSQEKGFRPRARKAPPSPSQDGGGEDLSKLSREERIERALVKMDKK